MALIIISLLVIPYCLITNKRKSNYTSNQVSIVNWIFIFMIIGIVLGTQVRENIENLIPFSIMGPFKYVHSFLGLGTLMLTGILWNKVKDNKNLIKTHKQIRWLLNIWI